MREQDGLFYPELEAFAEGRGTREEAMSLIQKTLSRPMSEWSFGETSVVYAWTQAFLAILAASEEQDDEKLERLGAAFGNAAAEIHARLTTLAPNLRMKEEDWRKELALVAKGQG